MQQSTPNEPTSLIDITEQLAAKLVTAEPNDLPLLASVHAQLQQIGREAAEMSSSTSLIASAGKAEKLVEQIILREVGDLDAALRSVGQLVTDIQQAISGKAGEPTIPAPAPGPSPSAFGDFTVTPAGKAGENRGAGEADGAAPSHGSEPIADAVIGPDDVPMVQEFITEAVGHLESAEAALLALDEDPNNLENVNALFRSFHTIKGVAGFLSLKQIGALSHAAENLLDLARNGKLTLDSGKIDLVLASCDLMKAMVNDLRDAIAQNRAPATQSGLGELIGRLDDAASGKDTPAASTGTATPSAGSSKTPAAGEGAAPAGTPAKSTTGDNTVKVATERLDSLINMVGELVIAQSMVAQDLSGADLSANQRLSRNMGHLGKITRELQDLSMSMRMVPIQGVFQKMARLVRDLSKRFGKEIEINLVGGETELDRNVVEAISDPLVHMVRNSLDHGIEPPEEREKAGKPRTGHVELRAYHQAGSIVIEISDDGRGINKARVIRKAIDAGILREDQDISDTEAYKLIFHAGLSTAEKLTDVSGRGVGMDVVRKNVEAMRGRIDITSTLGKGTTFTIRLPLTLAVIDGLVVRVGNEQYIIPITSVEQNLRPRAEQLSTVQNRGEMCMVRGELLPLIRLYEHFGIEPQAREPTEALVVIVQDDTRRCCILVDELVGQQQVVIKSLGGIGAVEGISGGAILGDGNVSLILDIPGIVDLASR